MQLYRWTTNDRRDRKTDISSILTRKTATPHKISLLHDFLSI